MLDPNMCQKLLERQDEVAETGHRRAEISNYLDKVFKRTVLRKQSNSEEHRGTVSILRERFVREMEIIKQNQVEILH